MNKHGVDKVKELISNQTTNETTEESKNESTETENNEVVDQNTSAENTAANE